MEFEECNAKNDKCLEIKAKAVRKFYRNAFKPNRPKYLSSLFPENTEKDDINARAIRRLYKKAMNVNNKSSDGVTLFYYSN